MRIYPVFKKVVQGGSTDGLGPLTIVAADTIAAQSDAYSAAIADTFGDVNAAQIEAVTAQILGLGDVNAGQVESLLANIGGLGDSQAIQSEALQAAVNGLGDSNATPTEAVQAAISGLGDSQATPTEARSSVLRCWASGCTDNDSSKTSPSNANGPNDGSFAAVSTNKSIGDTTNPVTLTTGSMNVPNVSHTSAKLRLWFQVGAVAGVVADGPVTISGNNGVGTIWTLPAAGQNYAGENFSSGTFTFDISGLSTAQLQSLVLTAKYTAAVVAAPQTSISLDACAVDVVGAA